MKGQLKVATPEEYIAQVDPARRNDVTALDGIIRKTAPKLTPFIQSGMLAYGPCRYKYPNGKENDWFRIGIASNKQYISMYVWAGDAGYIAERYKDALPKAKIGKACVRFKQLDDLDPAALKKLIRETAKGAGKD